MIHFWLEKKNRSWLQLTIITLVGSFLFTTIGAPFAQANLYEERSGELARPNRVERIEPRNHTIWQERRKAVKELEMSQAGSEALPNQDGLLAKLPVISPTDFSNSAPSFNSLGSFNSSLPKTLISKNSIPDFPQWITSLPLNYATFKKTSIPSTWKAGDPIVIHIQDAHLNKDAQTNIGKSIQHFIENGKIDLVALEGSFGPIDLNRFHTFPNQDLISKVADYLLKKNKISGAVHTAFTIGSIKFLESAPGLRPSTSLGTSSGQAQDRLRMDSLPSTMLRAGRAGSGQAQVQQDRLSASANAIPLFIGIDDKNHYDANVDAYKQSFPKVTQYRNQVTKIEKELEKEKSLIFNPELLVFDKQVEAYREHKIKLGDYIKYLHSSGPENLKFLKALQIEEKLDFSKVEKERSLFLEKLVQRLSNSQAAELMNASLAYRLGNVKQTDFYIYLRNLSENIGLDFKEFPLMGLYIRYALLSDEIDADKLFDEVKVMEKKTYASLAKSQKEKQLIKESKNIHLVSKLISSSLTREEWKEYEKISSDSSAFDLKSFENFYRESLIRDEVIAKNLLKTLNASSSSAESRPKAELTGSHQPQVAVLVTGGFHSDGIEAILRNSNVAVVTYAPKITKVDTEKGNAYLSVFMQEKTPLQKLFDGEKLFLPPQILPEEIIGVDFAAIAAGLEEAKSPKPLSSHAKQKIFFALAGVKEKSEYSIETKDTVPLKAKFVVENQDAGVEREIQLNEEDESITKVTDGQATNLFIPVVKFLKEKSGQLAAASFAGYKGYNFDKPRAWWLLPGNINHELGHMISAIFAGFIAIPFRPSKYQTLIIGGVGVKGIKHPQNEWKYEVRRWRLALFYAGGFLPVVPALTLLAIARFLPFNSSVLSLVIYALWFILFAIPYVIDLWLNLPSNVSEKFKESKITDIDEFFSMVKKGLFTIQKSRGLPLAFSAAGSSDENKPEAQKDNVSGIRADPDFSDMTNSLPHYENFFAETYSKLETNAKRIQFLLKWYGLTHITVNVISTPKSLSFLVGRDHGQTIKDGDNHYTITICGVEGDEERRLLLHEFLHIWLWERGFTFAWNTENESVSYYLHSLHNLVADYLIEVETHKQMGTLYAESAIGSRDYNIDNAIQMVLHAPDEDIQSQVRAFLFMLESKAVVSIYPGFEDSKSAKMAGEVIQGGGLEDALAVLYETPVNDIKDYQEVVVQAHGHLTEDTAHIIDGNIQLDEARVMRYIKKIENFWGQIKALVGKGPKYAKSEIADDIFRLSEKLAHLYAYFNSLTSRNTYPQIQISYERQTTVNLLTLLQVGKDYFKRKNLMLEASVVKMGDEYFVLAMLHILDLDRISIENLIYMGKKIQKEIEKFEKTINEIKSQSKDNDRTNTSYKIEDESDRLGNSVAYWRARAKGTAHIQAVQIGKKRFWSETLGLIALGAGLFPLIMGISLVVLTGYHVYLKRVVAIKKGRAPPSLWQMVKQFFIQLPVFSPYFVLTFFNFSGHSFNAPIFIAIALASTVIHLTYDWNVLFKQNIIYENKKNGIVIREEESEGRPGFKMICLYFYGTKVGYVTVLIGQLDQVKQETSNLNKDEFSKLKGTWGYQQFITIYDEAYLGTKAGGLSLASYLLGGALIWANQQHAQWLQTSEIEVGAINPWKGMLKHFHYRGTVEEGSKPTIRTVTKEEFSKIIQSSHKNSYQSFNELSPDEKNFVEAMKRDLYDPYFQETNFPYNEDSLSTPQPENWGTSVRDRCVDIHGVPTRNFSLVLNAYPGTNPLLLKRLLQLQVEFSKLPFAKKFYGTPEQGIHFTTLLLSGVQKEGLARHYIKKRKNDFKYQVLPHLSAFDLWLEGLTIDKTSGRIMVQLFPLPKKDGNDSPYYVMRKMNPNAKPRITITLASPFLPLTESENEELRRWVEEHRNRIFGRMHVEELTLMHTSHAYGQGEIIEKYPLPQELSSNKDDQSGQVNDSHRGTPSPSEKPVDSYQSFYDSIRQSGQNITYISETDLQRSRTFLTLEGTLKSFEDRRANGAFGITEVYFLPESETQIRMSAFQNELRQKFGNKLYLVDADKLHFTTQGLELQWDNKELQTKKELAMHSQKEEIDPESEPFATVRKRARQIKTPVTRMQVGKVNWNPAIGIFWELRPYLKEGASDPILERRYSWDLPQPRPPHVTAAYFTQPFSEEELHELKKIIAKYQQNNYFGDIVVDKAEVIAYEDLSFNAGYRVLEKIPFIAEHLPNSLAYWIALALGARNQLSKLFGIAWLSIEIPALLRFGAEWDPISMGIFLSLFTLSHVVLETIADLRASRAPPTFTYFKKQFITRFHQSFIEQFLVFSSYFFLTAHHDSLELFLFNAFIAIALHLWQDKNLFKALFEILNVLKDQIKESSDKLAQKLNKFGNKKKPAIKTLEEKEFAAEVINLMVAEEKGESYLKNQRAKAIKTMILSVGMCLNIQLLGGTNPQANPLLESIHSLNPVIFEQAVAEEIQKKFNGNLSYPEAKRLANQVIINGYNMKPLKIILKESQKRKKRFMRGDKPMVGVVLNPRVNNRVSYAIKVLKRLNHVKEDGTEPLILFIAQSLTKTEKNKIKKKADELKIKVDFELDIDKKEDERIFEAKKKSTELSLDLLTLNNRAAQWVKDKGGFSSYGFLIPKSLVTSISEFYELPTDSLLRKAAISFIDQVLQATPVLNDKDLKEIHKAVELIARQA